MKNKCSNDDCVLCKPSHHAASPHSTRAICERFCVRRSAGGNGDDCLMLSRVGPQVSVARRSSHRRLKRLPTHTVLVPSWSNSLPSFINWPIFELYVARALQAQLLSSYVARALQAQLWLSSQTARARSTKVYSRMIEW